MRVLTTFALAAVLSSSIAFAQETTGAGRHEISAFPGGGVFFGSSSTETEPSGLSVIRIRSQ